MIDLVQHFRPTGEYILIWAFESAVVMTIAWIIVKLDRQHRPAYRVRVWTAALVGILLLPWGAWALAQVPTLQQAKQAWAPAVMVSSPEAVSATTKYVLEFESKT